MQLHHDAQRHSAGLGRTGILGSLAVALACSALGASPALANDDFATAFERELGRAVARHITHVVFDLARPHTVRYVPTIYQMDHRVHLHSNHRYEPIHYVDPYAHDRHRSHHKRGKHYKHNERRRHHERHVDHERRHDRHDRKGRREWHS